jgi:hypothetical protein
MARIKLTDKDRQVRQISEREWQRHVMDVATRLGWLFYHAPDNKPVNGRVQNITPGFPDLVLVKAPRIVYAELKRETGKLSPAQEKWLYLLRACGQEAYVWRPSNLNDVIATLRQKP